MCWGCASALLVLCSVWCQENKIPPSAIGDGSWARCLPATAWRSIIEQSMMRSAQAWTMLCCCFLFAQGASGVVGLLLCATVAQAPACITATWVHVLFGISGHVWGVTTAKSLMIRWQVTTMLALSQQCWLCRDPAPAGRCGQCQGQCQLLPGPQHKCYCHMGSLGCQHCIVIILRSTLTFSGIQHLSHLLAGMCSAKCTTHAGWW